ncbi:MULTISPECIES: GPP34 family phosphoprotein [unclassified Streptomyces]|uniref:GOLPH3/VPS74 family protein n=1 Tax=unclassified Streptomyces TaxID=2593676 RepID=UPI002E0F5523|nr:GPP34 family phosphoprotein [Streptomyces sp. NBC_01197]WSS50988.1 GPP34 family phosphoprotein [Streptomyces sp. NBC_01180]
MSQEAPTLPEELLLLALDPRRGKPFCRNRYLEFGMAGAALAELELQGRISESHGKVTVDQPLPPHDPVLARVLELLPAPDKRKSAGGVGARYWIRRTGRTVEGLYLDHLVDEDVLTRETRRFAGLLPYYRHPAGPRSWSAQARDRFLTTEAAGFPDPRSRALAALVTAVGLSRIVARDGGKSRASVRHLMHEEWTAHAVHRNVQIDRANRSGGG